MKSKVNSVTESGADRQSLFDYAYESYGTCPEYLWERDLNSAVLRHSGNENDKWYAVVMRIPRSKLGLNNDEPADILVIKSSPALIGSLIDNVKYFRAYHMNKEHWLTVMLDGSVPQSEVFDLLNLSFELTAKKVRGIKRRV